MTRITFLIGNGFDLHIGLNTSYKDFYEYYITKYPDDILARSIGSDDIYWADLELALGRYTGEIEPDTENDFWDSEERLEQELTSYLESQMKRVSIRDRKSSMETAIEMQRSLTNFHKELPEIQQQYIEEAINETHTNIVYSFITFNYTTVLDQCINAAKNMIPGEFAKHQTSLGRSYSHAIEPPLHIHGTTEAEMVFGVNDESQITNKEFTSNDYHKQLLIKEETNKCYNRGKTDAARKIIDDSMIICIFGMSIGRTDKIWWQYIAQWLQKNEKRRLIIYETLKYTSRQRIPKRILFHHQDEMLNQFKNNADLSDEEWEQIKEQVYVQCISDLFNCKIVDTTKIL